MKQLKHLKLESCPDCGSGVRAIRYESDNQPESMEFDCGLEIVFEIKEVEVRRRCKITPVEYMIRESPLDKSARILHITTEELQACIEAGTIKATPETIFQLGLLGWMFKGGVRYMGLGGWKEFQGR